MRARTRWSVRALTGALAATLLGCGGGEPAQSPELDVLVTAYRYLYDVNYADWRPSVAAALSSGDDPALTPDLEARFADAVGAAMVPEAEREIVCRSIEGEERCTFNGHELVVTASAPQIDGRRATLTLELVYPTPCEETRRGGGCVTSFVADGYDVELLREGGTWRVTQVERWFT